MDKLGMTPTQNVNLECLKSISNIGGTTYKNLCEGSVHYVQWGNIDWVAFSFICLLFITMVYILIWIYRDL